MRIWVRRSIAAVLYGAVTGTVYSALEHEWGVTTFVFGCCMAAVWLPAQPLIERSGRRWNKADEENLRRAKQGRRN